LATAAHQKMSAAAQHVGDFACPFLFLLPAPQAHSLRPALPGRQAVRLGNMDILQSLARTAPHLLSTPDSQGLTPFLTACACGRHDVAEWLYQAGFTNLHDREPRTGATGLHLATVRCHVATVRWLLAAMPQLVDLTTHDSATPLRIAAEAGYDEIASILLMVGANPLVADVTGVHPLLAARQYGHPNIYALLQRRALQLQAASAQAQGNPVDDMRLTGNALQRLRRCFLRMRLGCCDVVVGSACG
jgi:ankyrin repeat protein